MEHLIQRAAPPPLPPVEKITLVLTPREFLMIYRRFVRSVDDCRHDTAMPTGEELPHGIQPEAVYSALRSVARAAGIVR